VAERQVAAAERRSLVNDLKRVLRVEMLRGATSASHVAQILKLHRRTLNRRLSDCGTSFQQLLDEVRYDSARHLLHLTRMPLAHIAASLGYAEASAFTRAFRRWSGTTPTQFRVQSGPKVPGWKRP
jgi:AraC-like DNA-binding protein